MYLAVHHPWRSGAKGDLTLLLDPNEPELRLGFLPEDTEPEPGDEVEPTKVLGEFTLHRSPDDRVPDVAETVAQVLVDQRPAWLEERLLELLNNIHGFGTSRNPRGPGGKMGMDHPLAPLGVWGPNIEQVGREVRAGKFTSWEGMRERVGPQVYQPIREALPKALRDDVLGASSPQILLRKPL